ncbi:tuftelin 1b isoform X2 [Betta splendens]|uniref:Tuftelin 1b isoform X2 n=1 Tax=Betta splendens TaxID=158456 RepID=A0A6P7P157_BETSP|nr:tuftelin 1b isoform X2 [Betta splendens]
MLCSLCEGSQAFPARTGRSGPAGRPPAPRLLWHRSAVSEEQCGGRRVGPAPEPRPAQQGETAALPTLSQTLAHRPEHSCCARHPGVPGGATFSGRRHGERVDRCRRRRLTLQDQDQPGFSHKSGVAVVLPRKPEEQEETLTLIPPTGGKVQVVSVSVGEACVGMLTDEATQIQEVRYCLKTLREQMAARQNSNNNKGERKPSPHPANGLRLNRPGSRPAVTAETAVGPESSAHEESVKIREATRRLYAQLKEMDKKHQEEREKLQAESSDYRTQLDEQSERLQKAEKQSEERGQRVEELQRLLGGMEAENLALKEKMAAGEAELLQLKENAEGGEEATERCAELEKEVAMLKEKIHHLDDMLRCQQRKVRQMIEQLQNSRTVIQERDRVIGDLEEKLAYLEAENREMHDRIQYYLAGQDLPPLTSTENKPEIVYSKPLTPTSSTNKNLPFIKVIEIKS